ncbi:MAG: hypothetical protein AAF601_01970 [Pseudomonadota bacterium]
MDVTHFEYQFSLPTPIFYGILIAAALAIAAIALHLIRQGKPETEDTLAAQFGLGGPRLPIFVIAALMWIALALILLLGLFGLIFQTLTATSTDNYLFYVLRIAGLTTVLGAVIALPVTLMRLAITERQTQAQEQGLITDRTNAAVGQLGDDDPAVRVGAILQLERILRDSDEDRELVLMTLNAYIMHNQQLSRAAYKPVGIDVQAAIDVMLRQKKGAA